ncbi:hypothetical protein NC653_012262 [Populus alba x Populus x berolinensis]|uniref:At1g61320/AtMIF1 LRR domain-containing protein n=2 Tax=Populus alba x Populus x berolinensis TaxID=444605 RepID=A0AAD6W7L4_9ROSI|nr:hypothetical protein NC653_012262 [Populus alba x Populus x berolinensis]
MNIDRQINFAIEKKIKKLEMNLLNCRGISQCNKYFFPHKDFPTCNSLTTLRLKNVNVTGEVNIEHFLSNYSLVNLKVAGPLLRLKYLEIRYCSVKKVEISAVNLISFKYFRPKIRMPLKHAPRLVELAIGGYYYRYLYRIDTLTLHENMLKILDEVPVLTNLKQLKFITDVIDRDPTLLAITSLIEAASFLQRFIFQVLVLKLLTFGEENKSPKGDLINTLRWWKSLSLQAKP